MANSNEDEEFRLLFQVFIDDIRYSKEQQWKIIYLTLVAIGAILALSLGLNSKQILSEQFLPDFLFGNYITISLRAFLAGICGFISFLGIMYIWIYHGDIDRYRCKKELLMKTFTKKAQKISEKEPKWYKCMKFFLKKDSLRFSIPFCILIAAAGGIVFSLIWKISQIL